MIANYHSHTYRCRHASGTEEDYVNRAIESGFQIFGFSDHTPYPFPGDYYSTFRMYPHQLDDYCETIVDLKKRYVNQLEIHLGLEVEYYPAYFDELMARLRDTPVEYMLLGQHFVGSEIGEHYGGWFTDQKELLVRYVDQVIDAMQTGLFTYLAHPDLMNIQVDDKFYQSEMRRLCREAKACNMPLEINLLGMRCGKNYPDIRFWEMAAAENCVAVLGCDAHMVDGVSCPEQEKVALEMVDRLGLQLLETVQLRPIR